MLKGKNEQGEENLMLNDEVSKRIRELRIKKEITQEILSNKAGIDLSYLGKIERGQKNNISLIALPEIHFSGFFLHTYNEYFNYKLLRRFYLSRCICLCEYAMGICIQQLC